MIETSETLLNNIALINQIFRDAFEGIDDIECMNIHQLNIRKYSFNQLLLINLRLREHELPPLMLSFEKESVLIKTITVFISHLNNILEDLKEYQPDHEKLLLDRIQAEFKIHPVPFDIARTHFHEGTAKSLINLKNAGNASFQQRKENNDMPEFYVLQYITNHLNQLRDKHPDDLYDLQSNEWMSYFQTFDDTTSYQKVKEAHSNFLH